MRAQVIQLCNCRKAAPTYKARRSRKGAAESLFERTGAGYDDFIRGRKFAELLIKRAEQTEIEQAHWAIINEAVRRRLKGGEHSRKAWTPVNDGFLQSIARYVATAKISRA